MKIKISSRQSPLAQIQAYQVGTALKSVEPTLEIEYLFRQSLGDQNQHDPLWKMPVRGVFTEDFYADLANGATDMVVHSWKDLPTEEKEHTQIAATLPRADQRDVLLFKNDSKSKARLNLFSSSPRRCLNVSEFLVSALPWACEAIEFHSVRGNISTRVQKLLSNDHVDGLIVAKAAIDRLLTDVRFPEVQTYLRAALEQLDWMLLPLSANPNAAAQGALAIEVSRTNLQVQELLKKINCENTFYCANQEREILKKFGGGCHLALGMSVLKRSYGEIEIVKGISPAGDRVFEKKFYPTKKWTFSMPVARLEFIREASALPVELAGDCDAVFMARAEMGGAQLDSRIVWAAGLETWKKLAHLGVWVHGSAEGLGESEDPQIDILAGKKLRWVYLTHDEATLDSATQRLASYHLKLKLNSDTLPAAQAYRWKSGSEFRLALNRFPELKNYSHICGPGRSFESLKQQLGSAENIYVELANEFITTV